MSTALGSIRSRAGGLRAPARPPSRPPARSRLRAVSAPAAKQRSSAFTVMLVLLLGGGLVGLLLLNTTMQRSAFELEALREQAASLSVRGQVLDLQVERLRSPDRLARAATDLGMVPVPAPAFVRLSDGQVIGDPVVAGSVMGPQLVPVPPVREPKPDRKPVHKPRQQARQDAARQQGGAGGQGAGQQERAGQDRNDADQTGPVDDQTTGQSQPSTTGQQAAGEGDGSGPQ